MVGARTWAAYGSWAVINWKKIHEILDIGHTASAFGR
jgi:hypothetical protein